MYARFISFFTLILLLLANASSATDWRWEAAPSFLNPNLDPDLVAQVPWPHDACLYDLSDDGVPEYILYRGTEDEHRLYLAEQDGEFPDITWRLREDFFGDLVFDHDTCTLIVCDIDENGSAEVIIQPRIGEWSNEIIIFRNEGDYDNPNWIQANHLFPDIGLERICSPFCFCDFDADSQRDLFMGWSYGLLRYEQDENEDWAVVDTMNLFEEVSIVGFQLSDLDGDGDLDFIGDCECLCTWSDAFVVINSGSPDEPHWERPIHLGYNDHYKPKVYDLNEDGYPDIVDWWKYRLNTGEEDEAAWDRAVYWSGFNISSATAVISDFDRDGVLDIIKTFPCTYQHGGGPLRLAQYKLTDGGWQDTLMFGEDGLELLDGCHSVYRLAHLNVFEPDQSCLSIAIYRERGRDDNLRLYEDVNDGPGIEWQLVEGFFNSLIDTNHRYQTPTFADLDNDGDLDMVMLSMPAREEPFEMVFYEFTLDGREPSWERRQGWARGVMPIHFRSVEFADMDDDGDLDMLGARYIDSEYIFVFYENIGDPELPLWSIVPDAFDDGGPQSGRVMLTADVNYDGRPDIITSNTCYLNRTPSSVEDRIIIPNGFSLSAFPNPFNSKSVLMFELPYPGRRWLSLLDITGKEIAYFNLGTLHAGSYRITIDAGALSAGAYFARLDVGDCVGMVKLVVVK